VFAKDGPKTSGENASKARIVLFISEQNIGGPRTAWWASEVDLSATEAEIAKQLLNAGFEIIEPAAMDDVIKKEKAFRLVDLSEKTL